MGFIFLSLGHYTSLCGFCDFCTWLFVIASWFPFLRIHWAGFSWSHWNLDKLAAILQETLKNGCQQIDSHSADILKFSSKKIVGFCLECYWSEMDFLHWKLSKFVSNVAEVFSLESNWQYVSVGLSKGLVPNRHQAITEPMMTQFSHVYRQVSNIRRTLVGN